MTLRLILVGLVAALGLTIPRLSQQTNGAGTARVATTADVQSRTVEAGRRPVRTLPVSHQNLKSSNFYASRNFQPVGYGSGVVRTSSKRLANFWRIPSGSRIVPTSPAVVEVARATKPARKAFEPLEVDDNPTVGLADILNRESEGLPVEIQGPPARLKIKTITAENPPRGSLEPMMDVYEAIAKIATRTALETVDEPLPPPAPPAKDSATAMLLHAMKSDFDGIAGNAISRIEQTQRVFRTSWNSLRARAAVATTRSVELAAIPDDVFAPEIVVAVPRPVELANLPDDVFAPEIVAAHPIVASATVSDQPTQAKPVTSHAAHRPEHLTKAVSLTRDAAVAWMKLLSGPAVVTLQR
jgi:hypothetical protein